MLGTHDLLGAIVVAGGTLWSLGQAVCAARAPRTIRRHPALRSRREPALS
jgi:hypothetical protein